MLPAGLLPHLDGLSVEDVIPHDREVTLIVAANAETASCPRCTQNSDRVHSRYKRTLHDLPIGPKITTIRVRVRRFRCANRDCPQRIFAERFPGLGRARARRTHGQQAALEEIGLALGGAAGARLAEKVGMPTSRCTILRVVGRASDPPAPTPRVLGVDDWARLRGRTYGTILVDLERHHPVDLLEDRRAETLEKWLAEHPGVEVIARDRAGAYADGARKGAPKALQVADRFHLLANIGDALERVLARKHSVLKKAAAAVDRLVLEAEEAGSVEIASSSTPSETDQRPQARSTRSEQLKQARRARRVERYEAVIELHRQGLSLRAIGRELGLGKNTVKRFIRAGQFPERAERAPRTMLTPFEPYLRERWTAGCHNAHTLWEEIRDLGFQGSASLVRRFVGRWRSSPGRSGKTPRRDQTATPRPTPPRRQRTRALSPRQARWLVLRDDEELEPEQQLYREQLLEDEDVNVARRLGEDFGRIVREREKESLGGWLKEAESSAVGEFRQFALMLRRDLAAVEAALTTSWSNGQTEGQITRLKFLKRQMYGRASHALLRRRFLQAA